MPVSNRGHGTAVDARAVTPSDSVILPDGPCRSIYIGGAGNLVISTGGGATVTFVGLLAGTVLPVEAVQVRATGTTATNLVALY